MKQLVVYFVCFGATTLFGESVTSTCRGTPSPTGETRDCVQTKCNQQGVCIDTAFNEETRKDSPIPINMQMWNTVKQKITKVKQVGGTIKIYLTDGSVWNVPFNPTPEINEWIKKAQTNPIAITYSARYSPLTFNLTNISNNQSAKFEYDMTHFTVPVHAKLKKKITNFDNKQHLICLSDGSCWEYNSEYGTQLLEDQTQTPVFLGINTSLGWKDFPYLMLLVRPYNPPLVLTAKRIH